jgi:hypothetical protein
MQRFKLILCLILLAIILLLSSGVSNWFNGLPWANTMETLTVLIVLPFLIITGHRFLLTKASLIFLVTLLALKLILHLGAPSSGWKIQVSPKLENLENGDFIKTYFTVWQDDISAVLEKGWTHKKEFPIDWFTPIRLAPLESLNIVSGSLEEKFNNLSLWMSVEGVVRLPQGTKLIVLTQGTKSEEISATSLEAGQKGKKISVPIVHQLAEAEKLREPTYPARDWSISGKLKYLGNSWAFQPLLMDQDGNIKKISRSNILWQDKSAIENKNFQLQIYHLSGKAFDCVLIILLLVWSAWSIQHLREQKIISLPMVLFSLPVAILVWVKAFLVAGVGAIALVLWRPEILSNRENNLGKKFFLIFAPALLTYFTLRWWADLGQISLWSLGDDWTTYQIFSRLIVIEGQWLEAGEPIFLHQPFYRYIVAFFHWLFGPSAFAQRLADIWCIIGTATILVPLAIRFGLSELATFFVSSLFLVVTVEHLPNIGSGLTDYVAMFFVMLAGYLLSKGPKNYARVFIAGVIATLGIWLHLDRIGIAGAIACLLIKPKEGTPLIAWKNFLQLAGNNWKFLAVYLTTLGVGLFSVVLRNGLVGGHFGFVLERHPNYSSSLSRVNPWNNIYLILTGKNWPTFPLDTKFLTLVILPGAMLGLIALVWRPKLLEKFPLPLSITILGFLSPYLFLHIWGYAPRYSTQLLPLAALSMGIIFDHFYRNAPEKSLLNRMG